MLRTVDASTRPGILGGQRGAHKHLQYTHHQGSKPPDRQKRLTRQGGQLTVSFAIDDACLGYPEESRADGGQNSSRKQNEISSSVNRTEHAAYKCANSVRFDTPYIDSEKETEEEYIFKRENDNSFRGGAEEVCRQEENKDNEKTKNVHNFDVNKLLTLDNFNIDFEAEASRNRKFVSINSSCITQERISTKLPVNTEGNIRGEVGVHETIQRLTLKRIKLFSDLRGTEMQHMEGRILRQNAEKKFRRLFWDKLSGNHNNSGRCRSSITKVTNLQNTPPVTTLAAARLADWDEPSLLETEEESKTHVRTTLQIEKDGSRQVYIGQEGEFGNRISSALKQWLSVLVTKKSESDIKITPKYVNTDIGFPAEKHTGKRNCHASLLRKNHVETIHELYENTPENYFGLHQNADLHAIGGQCVDLQQQMHQHDFDTAQSHLNQLYSTPEGLQSSLYPTSYNQVLRVPILGSRGCGKTTLVQQFLHCLEPSVPVLPTFRPTYYYPMVFFGDQLVNLRLIDCPPMKVNTPFPKTTLDEWIEYCGWNLMSADAFVIVFDVNSDESFLYARQLREQIVMQSRRIVPIIIIANKMDVMHNGQIKMNTGNLPKFLHNVTNSYFYQPHQKISFQTHHDSLSTGSVANFITSSGNPFLNSCRSNLHYGSLLTTGRNSLTGGRGQFGNVTSNNGILGISALAAPFGLLGQNAAQFSASPNCASRSANSPGSIGRFFDINGGTMRSNDARRDLALLLKKQLKGTVLVECSARYNWRVSAAFKELFKMLDEIESAGNKPKTAKAVRQAFKNQCSIM